MRNDQIFVLLLVVLLPLSGCMDNTVGGVEGSEDSESNTDITNTTTVVNNYFNQTTNIPPIIHIASIGLSEESSDYGRVSTYNSSTGEELSRMYHVTPQMWFSVTDVDSNITEVGIDTDLDQKIDHSFFNNNSWSNLSFYTGPDIPQSDGSLANRYVGTEWFYQPSSCYVRFNLMAVDDQGGIQIIPYTLLAEGYGILPSNAESCQEDYTGLEE